MNIKVNEKDDVVLKLIHYFITKEDYKPIIINGIQNEIWLENMERDLQLIRINTNYIHNDEQLKMDTYKAKSIMKTIKKNTFSFKLNMLNLLIDTGDIDIKDNIKNIETIRIDKLNDFKKNDFINEFFPSIKDSELKEMSDVNEFFKLTDEMNEETIKKEKKLQKIFSPKTPVATYILIVLNLVLFLAKFTLNFDLDYYLGNSYIFLKQNEWYRLITCMFVHASIMHLLFNMYALYILGQQVEKYYGTFKFLLIYFISGIMGSLFSATFMSGNTISIGASGAIFGLLGSVAYFTYNFRATLQGLLRNSIIPVIVINLLLGLFDSSIDLAAHIGGLIGGVLLSMAIGIGDKERKQDEINGIVVTILMIGFLIYFIIIK